MNSIEEKVIEIIERTSDKAKIREMLLCGGNFTDIGLNSISYIKIIIALELEFDIEFDDIALDFSKFSSLNSICEYISNKIEGK